MVGLYESLQDQQARLESEYRTLQNISGERIAQSEDDLKEVVDEHDQNLTAHLKEIAKIDEALVNAKTELELKFTPAIETNEKQIESDEIDINTSIDSMAFMKQRLIDLRDGLKAMVVEHANKVAKDEIAKLDNEEKNLQSKIHEEETAFDHLNKQADTAQKMISAIQSKFSEQMSKAEKVLGILKKSKHKIQIELDSSMAEKNQLTVLNSHREETFYQLLEENKQLKQALEETQEAVTMLGQYKEMKAQNPHTIVPFTHNKLLNKIIALDNIQEQESEDYRKLIERLKYEEEALTQRHAHLVQTTSELKVQYNKAIEAAKKLSFEINKVFATASIPV